MLRRPPEPTRTYSPFPYTPLFRAPSLPTEYTLQVVSGRNLHEYHYTRSEGGVLQTPLGTMTTQQFQRITQKADEKTITVWVAPARNNLPVQIRIIEDGVDRKSTRLNSSH